MKKEHKFFEKVLDNDLNELYDYLQIKHKQILTNTLPEWNELTDLLVKKYTEFNDAPMKLNKKYNLFEFDHPSIKKLKNAIVDCVKEACDYYEIKYEEQDFRVRGWFNHSVKIEHYSVNPIKNKNFLHDHLNGLGAPDFHGYYCVNAEPSITYYKINNEVLFENHNINNRVIICENGHPHGRDDWFEDKPRVTIAFDVVPLQRLIEFKTQDKGYWIPLS
jgi:hypothetical protein